MRLLIKLLALFLTLLFNVVAYPQQQSLNNRKNFLIDSALETKMKESGMVGMSAAIIINKKLVWQKGYGYADKERNIPFSPQTIINIASISKVITGACLMKATEQGAISLDEDINLYLPFKLVNPYFPEAKITLRNLATHTSGLADRFPFYTDSTYFYGKDSPEDLGMFLKNYFDPGGKYYSKENFLNHQPGTYREYCNIGAGLAGYIVELRTRKKLNEYSRQYIFSPLKMKNTGWFLSEIDTSLHSKLYAKKGDSINQVQLYGITTYPDGGVRTSVADLSKFFICLLNDGVYNGIRILKKETVARMLDFQFAALNKPENIELKDINSGIFWATKMGGKRIGHNGSDLGIRTFMLADLRKEVGVILFVNTSLGEKEDSKYFEIYNILYQYGLQLKN